MQEDEKFLDVFLLEGWKDLMRQWQEARDTLVLTTHLVKTEQELYFRKGQIQQLDQCLAFEELVKRQIDEDNRGDAV